MLWAAAVGGGLDINARPRLWEGVMAALSRAENCDTANYVPAVRDCGTGLNVLRIASEAPRSSLHGAPTQRSLPLFRVMRPTSSEIPPLPSTATRRTPLRTLHTSPSTRPASLRGRTRLPQQGPWPPHHRAVSFGQLQASTSCARTTRQPGWCSTLAPSWAGRSARSMAKQDALA